jgi:hypothetical protein
MLAAVLLLLALAIPVESHLASLRETGGANGSPSLAAFAPVGRRAGLESVTAACLGGFRGVIADLLWMRAIRMQEEGRGYELLALLDGILRMQPHFASVWSFQADVLASDFGSRLVSPDPAEAYRWIARGVDVLKRGTQVNPTSSELEFALADLYRRKLSPMSVDQKTWRLLVEAWHGERVRQALAEGRPIPDFDPYLGLREARRHYLKAAEKTDISRARKLLSRRFAIRCLERMGAWAEAEGDWDAFLADLSGHDGYGPDSEVHRENREYFRAFMRQMTALLLETGKVDESRQAYGRMRRRFPEIGDHREVIREEIRLRMSSRNDRDAAMRLFERSRSVLGEVGSIEEIVGAPPGR